MTLTLDPDLDPALYPLAWLIGQWEGEGAATVPVSPAVHHGATAADGSADAQGPNEDDAPATEGRRIEQQISAEPTEDAALRWHMRTWVLDAPPPVPPTAAFANSPESEDAEGDDAQTGDDEAVEGAPERRLLLEETAYWRVTGPMPGQDLAAAAKAKPGTPEALVSYGLEVTVANTEGAMELYAGEVRGPRIRLFSQGVGRTDRSPVFDSASRMFGLVGGKLMWVVDRQVEGQEAQTYLSAELARA